MPLHDDLKAEANKIFKSAWMERDGANVPDPASIGLGNDAVNLDAVVLYADLAESTKMVDTFEPKFAAEVYKAYLHCCAKVIRSEGGEITAYDGDRVMAVYIGNAKNTSAARTALKLNFVRTKIIQPAILAQYPTTRFVLQHAVGVDASKLMVARTGIRGANDLVWVGRAANHAAKMASLPHDYPSRVSAEVYSQLSEEVKTKQGQSMWERATWSDMGREIYRSTWTWSVA